MEVNQLAEKLIEEQHPEEETIRSQQAELNEAWERLKGLSLRRQEKLFGAHEIQHFNRYIWFYIQIDLSRQLEFLILNILTFFILTRGILPCKISSLN